MPKWILKVLKRRLRTVCFVVLGLIGVIQLLSSYGYYNYEHIPLEKLDKNLYYEVNPKLIMNNQNEKCEYDKVIHSSKSVTKHIIPENYNDFMPNGIVNGSFSPDHCNPRFGVAILITYRNRQKQLNVFIPYIHNFLRKQNIHYKIYVIEQQDDKPWNKGILYNIGAKQAIADKFPCLILHDVDLLPLDESNLYACLNQPRHMSACIDKFRFILIYKILVGGVLAIRSDQYVQLNGFSNRFVGWGGEDDDFAAKILANDLEILRLPPHMSRYSMMLHKQEEKNKDRHKIMAENENNKIRDGYNSVRYESVSVKSQRLFTIISVRL